MKAIIFDWGGVCCKEGEPFASPALQAALSATPDEITKQALPIYSGYYLGAYDGAGFWRAIMRHFALNETSEINPSALSEAYLRSYEIYPDMLEFISRVKERYFIALLSNLTPEMRDEIRGKHGLDGYFHAQMYSCDADVRAKKPDPAIFRVFFEKTNLAPEACLFVDNSKENIQAAASVGMKTLLFKNREQFFSDIKSFVSP